MPGLSNGGAERVASILANNLASIGYKVLYLCVYSKVIEYEIDTSVEIRFLEINKGNFLSKFIRKNILIEKMIKKEKPDVVLSFVLNEITLSSLFHKNMIYSLRNDPNTTDNKGIYKIIRSIILNNVKRIVFQTSGARDFFPRTIQKKGVVIPNPLKTRGIPEWKGERSLNFVSLSRLNKQKNLPLLIHSFVDFHEKYPSFQLDIYGEGEEHDLLLSIISENNASEYIRLKGRTDKPLDVLSNARAFLSSSDYEGLSNSMLEAVCIGTPCICTDCPPGGAAQFIQNGINGYLVPVNSSIDFEQALTRLVLAKDQLNLQVTSENARKQLDEANITRLWERELLKICKRRT